MAEDGVVDPLSVAKDASLIKDAQTECGRLDILVCGTCLSVFHFIPEFENHKSTKCSESSLAQQCENDDRPVSWAFCLWRNKEIRSIAHTDKPTSKWELYQKWSKLSNETREAWITGGQTLLSLNKMRLAKMQEVKFKVKREGDRDPLSINSAETQPDFDKKMDNSKSPTPSLKMRKDSKLDKEDNEFVVESILGKRFNAKKKHWEYKVKWENWDDAQCSWEPVEHLTRCKELIQQFEEKLKEEKAKKKLSILPKVKTELKTDDESDFGTHRRPERSSKKKAISQVKRWLGDSSDNEDGGGDNKRAREDDDSDDSYEKKLKLERDSDESFDEDDDDERVKRPAKSRNLSNGGLSSNKKIPHNLLIPDAQGIVRINQKQLPTLSSGVYIMSKMAGIIKLDSQTTKIAASGGQAVVKVAPRIGQTHIRVVKKDGVTGNRLIQMGGNKPKGIVSVTPRSSPGSTKVTRLIQRTSSKSNTDNKSEERMDVEEDDDGGLPELEFPSEIVPPENEEENQTDFTLDPETGKIAGMEYPDPEPQPEINNEENNRENSLENIVKLAAADITEADLKSDHDSSEIEQKKFEEQQQQTIKIKRESTNAVRAQQKFVITPNVKSPSSSNILERTLQSPRTVVRSPQSYARQVYTTKTPQQRVLNSSMTPKLTSPMNPGVRTVVRSGYASRPKQIIQKQRIYMPASSASAKYSDGVVRQAYFKQSGQRRVGNIGGTTIYKKGPQQTHVYMQQQQPIVQQRLPSMSPKTAAVRKPPVPIVRTVVQKTATAPKPVINMPSLLDDDLPPTEIPKVEETPVAEAAADAETDLSNFTLTDGEAPIFITGDDGTVYQVAGQNEEGQTILITQGPDGQQQCLLVTNDTPAQETAQPEESTVGVNDLAAAAAAAAAEEQAQAEAVAATAIDEASLVASMAVGVEEDGQQEQVADQVVAQVVRAEPPSPGGTHKVVVMLPDGKLMVTEVSPEEFASLELDK